MAVRRLREPDPVRRRAKPAYDGVLALRPGRGARDRGHRAARRGDRVGDLSLVRSHRRDRARRPGRGRGAGFAGIMTTVPDALPERVRARLIAYAADALGALPADNVPGPLKRAAQFSPQRRARVAGEQILDQLSSDEVFRERVG